MTKIWCHLSLFALSRPKKPDPAGAQTGVRSRFNRERIDWKKYQKAKDDEAITNAEKWLKPSQKVKDGHRDHFNEGRHNESTKIKIKKSIEANANMNMTMSINVNMNMNVNINMTTNR
jgi:hypothetical protein